MAFTDDIQSRDTALFPVVTFSDSFRISTKPFTLDGENYSPLLLSSPSIKESIDLENRKYKISNVSLKISNVEYNGLRFTDTQIPMNTEVLIHWVSPSCTNIGMCYLAYQGTVRAITHDEKTCNITLEDISQSTLHRDVPVALLTGDEALEKYKNKPYPMVYGEVDYSPCVVIKNIDDSSISIKADNITIAGFNESQFLPSTIARSPLNFYSGSKIVNISHQTAGGTNSTYDSHYQFETNNNYITISPEYAASSAALPANNYADNLLECQIFRIPTTPELVQDDDQTLNPYDYIVEGHSLSDIVDKDLSTYLEWQASNVDNPSTGSISGVWFSMQHNNFEPYGVEDNIYESSTYYITKFDLEYLSGSDNEDFGVDYQVYIASGDYYSFFGYPNSSVDLGDTVSFNNFTTANEPILLNDHTEVFDGAILSNNLRSQLSSGYSGQEFNIKIYGVALWHIFEYDFSSSSSGILDKTFYVNVTGRT